MRFKGSQDNLPKKQHPGTKKNNTQKQWKNVMFLQNEAGAAGQEKQQILRFMGNPRNPWGNNDFQPLELAARSSNPRRSPAHG